MSYVFDRDELRHIGEYPAEGKRPALPVLNTPITPKENFKRLLDGQKPLWMPSHREMWHVAPLMCPDNLARGCLKSDRTPPPAVLGGLDMFGVEWEYVPQVGGSMVRPGTPPLVPDITCWEDYVRFPDLDSWDWAGCSERNNRFHDDQRFTCFWVVSGLFERLISFIGMEDALMSLVMEDECEAVMRLFDALADFYDRYFAKIAEYFDVDAVYFHDDWGSQRAPLFSLNTCMEVIVPAMRKICDAAHRHGLYLDLHSCGKSEALVPAMVAAGVDCWLGQPLNDPALSCAAADGKLAIGVELPLPTDDAAAFETIDRFLASYGNSRAYLGPFVGSAAAWEHMYEASRTYFSK